MQGAFFPEDGKWMITVMAKLIEDIHQYNSEEFVEAKDFRDEMHKQCVKKFLAEEFDRFGISKDNPSIEHKL